jgi:Ca2+-binding RTX toxin-like protein
MCPRRRRHYDTRLKQPRHHAETAPPYSGQDGIRSAIRHGPARSTRPVRWRSDTHRRKTIMAIFSGTETYDSYLGTSEADTIDGGGGDDHLDGAGGGDVLHGDSGDDELHGQSGEDTLFGGEGGDDMFGGPGRDNLYGEEGDDDLYGGTSDDGLVGGRGDDDLHGNGGDDYLSGGRGADFLFGDDGIDMATYSDSLVGVQVDLGAGTATGGTAEGDYLQSIEELGGSPHADILTGSSDANQLFGAYGDDVLDGRAGADRLEGGNGTDTASYAASAAGVAVDLATGFGSGGDAQGDTLTGIETLVGSAYNDTLTGAAGGNTLAGGAGNDVLRGGAGADALQGGAGVDTASYYTGSSGVEVSLVTGTGSGGDAQGDTLSGIENLSGSQGNDGLVGDSGANTLQGWNGNDVLTGAGGKDTLTGGAGGDRFVYGSVGQSVVGANADRITDFSHAQGDRIDLSAIDASTMAAGNQAFSFIGSGLYTGVAGQLRYAVVGGVTTIAGDVNGDGTSDFHIQLTGSIALVAGDFVL